MTLSSRRARPRPSPSRRQTAGRSSRLDSLKGSKVVLYFYPKDDTSGCTLEAQDFQALQGRIRGSRHGNHRRLADSLKSHDKFRAKYGLDFALASDEDKAMLEAYGVWVEKSMYGRKYMGVERTTVLIDRERQDRPGLGEGEGPGPRRGGPRGRESPVTARIP